LSVSQYHGLSARQYPFGMRHLTQRLEWIGEIRGFLALYVLLHHATLNVVPPGHEDGLWQTLHWLFGQGHWRVDAFFVLSSFCLTLPLRGAGEVNRLGTFWMRRCARLLPPYYAGLAITLALVATTGLGTPSGTHWDVSLPIDIQDIWAHVFLVHQWTREWAVSINHPYWSIGVEFQMYFAFPVLIWLHDKLGPWRSWAVVTVVSYAMWKAGQTYAHINGSAYGASFYYLSLFSMGISAAQVRQRQGLGRTPSRQEWPWVLAVVALMCAWQWLDYRQFGDFAKQIDSFFFGLAMFGVLRLIGSRQGSLFPAQTGLRPLLAWLGERSFSLYLVHAPILELVWRGAVREHWNTTPGAQCLMEMLLGALASLAAAEVFYRLIELPVHNWSRGIGRMPANAVHNQG
jgi:peptidoglycan/LPS O-acetylase OafA/YrhL